jgi:hypothetical protein
VFLFSLQLLSETFLILRRIQRGADINARGSPCKVIKLQPSRQIFEKHSNITFYGKRAQWEPSWSTDGRTDMTKLLIVPFRNLANAPNKAAGLVTAFPLFYWLEQQSNNFVLKQTAMASLRINLSLLNSGHTTVFVMFFVSKLRGSDKDACYSLRDAPWRNHRLILVN